MTAIRQTQIVVEALSVMEPALRQTQMVVEVLVGTAPIFDDTLTISGISGASGSSIGTWGHSLSIAGSSGAARVVGLIRDDELSIAGSSSIIVFTLLPFEDTLTIAGSSGATALIGSVIIDYLPLDTFSGLTLLPGWGYIDTLDIEGVSDTAGAENTVKIITLSIEGVSGFDTSVIGTFNHVHSIAGIANFVKVGGLDTIDTVALDGTSTLYPEYLYDFLAVVSASVVAHTADRFTTGSQIPAGFSGLTGGCTGVFNRTVVQTLVLDDDVSYKKPTGIVDSLATLNQIATYQYVNIRSLIQTLTLTQDTEAWRAVSDTLTLSQDADATKVIIRTVSQDIQFLQTASRNTVINVSLTDTLEFPDSRLVFSGINGFNYYVGTAFYSLRPVKCQVILSVPERTILLPCPNFGDSENLQNSLDLKRTMTGSVYTYVKSSKLSKLKYDFSIWSQKYLELESFLRNYSERVIRMDNWKGETWFVIINNNPIEFSAAARYQPKGEKYNVSIEFQGVKANAS